MDDDWKPHAPHRTRLRVRQTSCCNEYELVADAGRYFVRRRRDNWYEETVRGGYAQAAQTYADLTSQHECERPAP